MAHTATLGHGRLLQESNGGTYIWMQLVIGVLYAAYFVLQCLALCQSKALDMWCVIQSLLASQPP
jgi:hypothetical protein